MMLQSGRAIVWRPLYSGHRHYLKREIGVWVKELLKKRKLTKALTITHNRPTYFDKFPYEVATGDYIILAGGSVHYTNGQWYGREKKWLMHKVPSRSNLSGDVYCIDAIDFKETGIEKHGVKHIEQLQNLKYLSFADCPFVDDNCMAQLVNFRDTLTHLDISRCPQITSSGIATLHKLRNLQKVNMNGLNHIQDLALVSMMLEDIIPNLRLRVVTDQLKRLEDTIKYAKDHAVVLDELEDGNEPSNNGLILDELDKNSTTTKRNINR